jgi:hypothetical protein
VARAGRARPTRKACGLQPRSRTVHPPLNSTERRTRHASREGRNYGLLHRRMHDQIQQRMEISSMVRKCAKWRLAASCP